MTQRTEVAASGAIAERKPPSPNFGSLFARKGHREPPGLSVYWLPAHCCIFAESYKRSTHTHSKRSDRRDLSSVKREKEDSNSDAPSRLPIHVCSRYPQAVSCCCFVAQRTQAISPAPAHTHPLTEPENEEMTGQRMGEHRPLLLSAPRDIAITIHGDAVDEYEEYVGSAGRTSTTSASAFRYTNFRSSSGSLAAVSPRYYQHEHKELVQAQAQAALLSRKYVAYPVEDVVGQKRSRSKVAVAGYGTMPIKPESEDDEGNAHSTKKKTAPSSLRSLLCKMDDPRKTKSCSSFNPEHLPSNQSETESDSDGSCGSNTTSSSSSLQSILRIRDGIYACRKVKKQVSVEFSLDVDYKDIDEEADGRRKTSGLMCASNCMPRRLTIEEKAALYRVRPDLQLTPMPLILRELEEIRRRRQRKLMFSILGGTLIMLMIIVFYYLLTETP